MNRDSVTLKLKESKMENQTQPPANVFKDSTQFQELEFRQTENPDQSNTESDVDFLITDEEIQGTKLVEDTGAVLVELVKNCGAGDIELLRDLEEAFIQQSPMQLRQQLIELLVKRESRATNDEWFKQRYSLFRVEELKLSRRPDYLIRPSGILEAKLGLMLHYPTFTCHPGNYIGGEIADKSSPCPGLLMSKGFDTSNTFWFENSWRREVAPKDRASVLKTYPTKLQEVHRKFSIECERSAACEVILVTGKENRLMVESRPNITSYTVSVGKDISIRVGIETTSQDISRIFVFVHHPEWMFFKKCDSSAARLYDACTNLAALLADVEVDYSFFERRAVILQCVRLSKAGRLTDLTEWKGDTKELASLTMAECITFAGLEAQRARCKELNYPNARASVQARRATGWKILAKTWAAREAEPSMLGAQRTFDPSKPILTMCFKCKSKSSYWMDTNPGFEEGTRRYIAKARVSCPTIGCCPKSTKSGARDQKKRQTFVPVDLNIPYVRANNLSARDRNKSISARVSKSTSIPKTTRIPLAPLVPAINIPRGFDTALTSQSFKQANLSTFFQPKMKLDEGK